MNAPSITTRVILASTLLFGLLLGCFSVVVYRSSRDAELATLDARLERDAAAIQAELAEAQGDDERFDGGPLPRPPGNSLTGARFQFFAPRGTRIIVDTLLDRALHAGRPEASDSSRRHFSTLIRGIPHRVLRTGVEIEEQGPYMLEVAVPMAEAEDRLARLRVLLIAGTPASLILAALAAYLITRTALRPIASMTETALSITGSNLDRRITVPASHDEVRLLAETLNGMIERIDSAVQRQKHFVADASHELRTPLTILTTELEYAEKRSAGGVRKSMRIALGEVGRLARLTDGLLLLARLEAPHPALTLTPVPLDALLTECVRQMTGPARRKSIRLLLETSSGPTVEGDRPRLKSVFLNLLDNAITYSPPRTTVTVQIRKHAEAAVSIRDEGYGISAQDLDRVFQRFFRASTARADDRGSGLGLAIAELIVRLHKGRIEVSSTPGQGSTFTVVLPLPTRI